MSNTIMGYVEKSEDNAIVGWAYDPNAPESAVRVQARVKTIAMQEVQANIRRDDLLVSGIGTGFHGFRMPVLPELFQLFRSGEAEIWVSSTEIDNWHRLMTNGQRKPEQGTAARVLNVLKRVRNRTIAKKSSASLVSKIALTAGSEKINGSPKNLAEGHKSKVDFGLSSNSIFDPDNKKTHASRGFFEFPEKLFGCIEVQEADKLSGWMLASRNNTTPILMIDDLPAKESNWPLSRADVTKAYGIERRAGFSFRYEPAPGAKAELVAFDGRRLMSSATVFLPESERPHGATMIRRLIEDAAKPDSVAVTCWDGAHNPIGRAKVLYDILDGRRPVWLFTYLFDEFGGELWPPIADSGMRIVAVPWKHRDYYHRLFQTYEIKFSTVWMCKPRLPTLQMAASIAAEDAKLVLDFDDNEEHFSKSPGSTGKPYGEETIGLVRSLIREVKARTAASLSLATDYNAEIVRHARKPASFEKETSTSRTQILRIGFVGTVRPHKQILEAAQAIRVTAIITGRELEFCVHGDIKPNEYRMQLEANSVKTHGSVLESELEPTLRTFDMVLTGYPSLSPGDEPITRYQITSKIGDALRNAIPALVPRSRSVEDLEGIPGIFLFDADDFADVLLKAANYKEKIKLPNEFTTAGAYLGFEKAERAAPADSSALQELFATRLCKNSKRSVLLIWKQLDGGLYGRRIDQIARAIKLSDPDVTVRVVEFMNESVRTDLQKKAQVLASDAAQILQLSELKQAGVAESSEGVIYNQILVKTDAEAASAFVDFLWFHGHTPSDTVMVVFPAFSLLTHLAKVIDPFTIISDIVDNQLSWGNNKVKCELIAQYVWLMRKSRAVVFNSSVNLEYFKSAGFLENRAESTVSVIPNWYMLPSGASVPAPTQLETDGSYVDVIYSGNLNDRIDWSLLERCAKASPYLRLHIVGDGFRVMDRLRSLMAIDNVIYHGPLSEERVSVLLRKVHFAVMPHLQDEVSTYMNPIKVLMYAGHGLRSIAIDVPGLNEINGLTVVDTADVFCDRVSAWVNEVREGTFARLNSMDETSEFAEKYVDLVTSEFQKF